MKTARCVALFLPPAELVRARSLYLSILARRRRRCCCCTSLRLCRLQKAVQQLSDRVAAAAPPVLIFFSPPLSGCSLRPMLQPYSRTFAFDTRARDGHSIYMYISYTELSVFAWRCSAAHTLGMIISWTRGRLVGGVVSKFSFLCVCYACRRCGRAFVRQRVITSFKLGCCLRSRGDRLRIGDISRRVYARSEWNVHVYWSCQTSCFKTNSTEVYLDVNKIRTKTHASYLRWIFVRRAARHAAYNL